MRKFCKRLTTLKCLQECNKALSIYINKRIITQRRLMNEHKPLEELTYSKSNELVSAKFKSSLLENQLVAIALTRIETSVRDDKSLLKARLYPGELKRLIGDPTHIYTRLKRVSKNMTGHSIVLEDGQGNFKAFAIVTNADYINGILEITLNNELRPHILGLEKRYTTLDLSVMTSFKRDSSFRLYEIFKSHIYKSNKHINDGVVDVEYGVAELRFMIGLANADDDSINSLRIRMGNNVDWDLLYEKLDDRAKTYRRWAEFERNVLKPAQEELKMTADIQFDYEPLRNGRSIARIRFSLYPNTPASSNAVDEKRAYLDDKKRTNRQRVMPRDLPQYEALYEAYVGHNGLSAEDVDILIEKADYEIELVEQCIAAADKQQQLDNYMGWIIRCIENGGYKQIGTLNGSKESFDAVTEIKENYQKNKDDVAIKAWEKIKTFAQFDMFMSYMKTNGLDLDALELVYSPRELVAMYTNYNKNGKIEL